MYTLSFTRLLVLFTILCQVYFRVRAAYEIPTCAGTAALCTERTESDDDDSLNGGSLGEDDSSDDDDSSDGDDSSNEGGLTANNYCIKGNELFQATSDGCVKQTIDENKYYVYQCTDENCTNVNAFSNGTEHILIYKGLTQIKTSQYYFDSTKKKLFKCDADGKCPVVTKAGYYHLSAEKKLIEVDSKGVASAITDEKFYLDEVTKGDSGYTKVVKCSATECEAINTEGYYVNGNPTKDVITDALIKCDGSKCEATGGTANAVYINGSFKKGSSEKRLIICESTKCEPSEVADSITTVSYFVNGANASSSDTPVVNEKRKRATNYEKALIQCPKEKTEPCTLVDGAENNIYLNGNKTDSSGNRLIICASDKCEASDVDANIKTVSYFVNGANVSSSNEKTKERKRGSATQASPYKNALIQCPTEKTKPCTLVDGAKNNIYLNGNQPTDEDNYLIICGDSCVVAAGKATSEDEYYVNAGASDTDKLNDTLIQCTKEKCETVVAKEGGIYVNTIDKQLIQCSKDDGCVAKSTKANSDGNEFFINSSDDAADITKDIIKCSLSENNDGTKECKIVNGEELKVYVNARNTTEVIYCLSKENGGCKTKASQATETTPEYYLNGDDIDYKDSVDTKKLKGDLIECKMNKSVIKCSVINGNDGDVYINSNYNKDSTKGDATNQIIQCSKDEGCVGVAVSNAINVEKTELATLPLYFLNSGNKGSNKFQEALIKCAAEGDKCEIVEAAANDVYTNGNANQKDKPLIKCNKSNCSAASSAATDSNMEYYINAGKVGEQALEYDVISCSVSVNEETNQKETQCKCLKETEVKSDSSIYLNSNYSEAGDSNQLIQCSKDNGCVGIKSETTSKINEYYVNAESDTLANAIIYCNNKNCEKQTPESTPVYFVGKDSSNGVDGLIECNEVEEAADADAQAANRKRATATKCVMKPAFNSEGYYLNSGSDKATNQVILCDASEGCSALKVDLGYYVNAGNPAKPIIKCEKEANECTEDASPSCPASNVATPGNYCYENGQLKFFASNNSTAVVATKYEDAYAFATIPAKEFPGIRTETGSLFKISNFFINRYYKSGVVMIDKNGKLVETLTDDQSDISTYDCDETTKVCVEKSKCTPNTYMYDSENKKAIFCNNGKMEYAKFSGYVIDGNRVSNGSKHPYLISCESNGENCASIKPKIDTYYENSGYDSSTNALIQCSSNNCFTTTATIGYYAAHGVTENSGVIKCTSANSCTYSFVKGNVKYVNAGFDKISNALISCSKNKGCSVTKAKIGYYLTYSSALLIQCTSPSSCVEFTPSVNYYDNADTTESSNTIINCVQNSNVVSCGLEATNNGFYMSSVSNVLIRCKAGKKCKTVTVKNGMFRGALKGLTSSGKRNVEVEDSEVDGKKVAVRGDSDEAYGIIRCVAGKCTALSPSELAAIPICEFNNNKCYITNEYAMTKTATTSITAGNICTNEDRSVFYFATDTVVVKPDVISAITSTYVYTTTNSNCLEVNDSYDDMYFTVGPNIYLLDQGSVLQFYDTGYYFINVEKNILVKGNEISAYNNENVKLYSCDGTTCNILNKPESVTYYADVNKRILKYDIQNDVYSFAYEKDITCGFVNNKCTPNADLNAREFCITYKGEIVLATTDIKNRETGECYRANSMNSNIYGFSQSLYSMNLYSAQMVDQTGYYIISRSTNSTVVSKNYKAKNNNLVVYGCTLSQCKVVEPDENVYYYDPEAKTILRYKNGVWSTPSASGYAYISINPSDTYVYKFSKKGEEITVQSKANYGYYYTVDNEMYHCELDGSSHCTPISETGYYFTNIGEVYYCVHDSEELEETECTKQACVSGQYYYISDAYYRCEVSSLLTPVVSRYCSHDDNVIINYPLALNEELPDNIKQAVEGIEKNNNSTAVIKRTSIRHYLESVSGVFTNCTYNVEETKSTFDLVCVNNFVTVDKEFNEVKICSVEQLGYVECVEDENNPEKCNISAAYAIMKPSILVVFLALILTTLYHLY